MLRLATIDVKSQASLVPVDYCANLALACAWRTAQDARKEQDAPPIYQLAPSAGNKITHGEFKDHALDGRMRCPLTKMLWYPFLHCMTTLWLFPWPPSSTTPCPPTSSTSPCGFRVGSREW